jgi:hypothetical protein
MRYLRDYRLFESSDGLTDEQRKFLDKYTDGSWSVNSEGLVDVEGSFWCENQGLEDFLGIRFGRVSGYFWCYWNQLRTLEGSPREVVGNFDCDGNQLKTLEGAPKKVGGDFSCDGNPLISLQEAPEVIKGGFRFKETWFEYNLQSFLEFLDKIGHDKPDEISLLLTHHFFTPQVIKEQITKNPDFPYYVSLVWNTEEFKKTQEELKKTLPENILVKIDDLWSIGGYL